MPFRCALGPWTGDEEPNLDEILAEPIVRLTMARYGVSETEIRRLVQEVRERQRLASSLSGLGPDAGESRTVV